MNDQHLKQWRVEEGSFDGRKTWRVIDAKNLCLGSYPIESYAYDRVADLSNNFSSQFTVEEVESWSGVPQNVIYYFTDVLNGVVSVEEARENLMSFREDNK